jgi:EAL domain-containing protein (putative c-di-GMP-specific phosphodiesterase class I)
VKIDRAFVNKILDTDFDRQLVEYTIKLCHSVDLDICVEGVEQKAQYDLLSQTCHADAIQGYLFGRPESEADFEQKYVRGVGESQMPIQKVVKY